MKKTFLFCICAMLMLTLGFTACSDDDDDNGSASTTAGVLDATTGLRLTEAGSAEYTYDAQGRVSLITVNNDDYIFDYNRSTIKYKSYYGDSVVYSVKYNGAGFLASYSGSEKYDDSDGVGEGTYETNLGYDKSGHITGISKKSVEKYVESDGTRTTDTYNTTVSFTWSNNRLTKIVYNDKGVEDGDSFEETETYTFDYEDGYVNKFNQWTINMWTTIGQGNFYEDPEQLLSCIGLLGVGPAELPSSVNVVISEKNAEGEYSNERNSTFGYSFNDDGSLYSSRGGYGGYSGTNYYYYENTKDNDADSPRYVQGVANDNETTVSTKASKRTRSIFAHRHRRLNK